MAFTQALRRTGALALTLLLCSALSQAQTFPCPAQTSDSAASPSSNSPAIAGGYSNISPEELYNNADLLDISLATNASWAQWVEQDSNFTVCDNINDILDPVEFRILQVCSQVVAGTNYGIKFIAQYSCLVDNETILGQDNLILNAVVYVPLPTNGQEAAPQVQEVFLDTSVPVEELEIPVEVVAAPAGSEYDDDSSDDVLAAAPTSSPSPSPPPYTLEGL